MSGPEWTEGCPSCSLVADHFDGVTTHLANREINVVAHQPAAGAEKIRERLFPVGAVENMILFDFSHGRLSRSLARASFWRMSAFCLASSSLRAASHSSFGTAFCPATAVGVRVLLLTVVRGSQFERPLARQTNYFLSGTQISMSPLMVCGLNFSP